METGIILLMLGLFYFAAHGLSIIFKVTRVPDVLILVFAGILIGPLLNLATVEDFGRMGSVMTVVALAVILFESGTSLRLTSLGKSLGSTVSITFVTAFATVMVLALLSLPFLGGDWGLAFLTGAMLCGTSSAVVIPMVQSLKMGDKAGTVLVIESALTDVICIVLTFALVESMVSGGISVYGISGQVAKSLGFAAIVGVLGGLFWLKVWNQVRKLPNSIFTTIAFAFVLYGLAEAMGISGAIANLAFGITLANLPGLFAQAQLPSISETESRFFQEIVFLLKTFFFVYLGVSIHIDDPVVVGVACIIVGLIYFLRLWITRFLLPKDDVTLDDAIITSVMVPKGLAPAVLVSLVMQKGIERAEVIQAIVYSVIILSIVFTAALIPLARRGKLGSIYKRVLAPFQGQLGAAAED